MSQQENSIGSGASGYERALAEVKQNAEAFKDVEPEHQSWEMCEAAFRGDPLLLSHVHAQTEHICALALMFSEPQNVRAVFESAKEQTEFLLGVAITRAQPGGIECSPLPVFRGEQKLTHAMFSWYFNKCQGPQLIDKRFDGDPRFCAISGRNRRIEEWVKAGKATTASDCWMSLMASADALEHLHKAFQTEEMCVYAVSRSWKMLKHVQTHTPFLIGCFLGKAPHHLEDLVHQRPDDCRLCVSVTKGAALRYVRKENLSQALVRQAFSYRTDEIPEFNEAGEVTNWNALLKCNAFHCVPKYAITYEHAVESVENTSLKNIPRQFRTPDLCKRAVAVNAGNFEFVPNNLKTMAMCMEAVQGKGTMLKHVPGSMKNAQICGLAIKNDVAAEIYMPVNLIEFAKSYTNAKKKRKS